uniref:Ixodegrin B n=1 Tax=Rhipicephalus zambeziensis TaxID=60191 RepID=A0A224YB37_9ACAR
MGDFNKGKFHISAFEDNMQCTRTVTFLLLLTIHVFETKAYYFDFQQESDLPQRGHNKGYGRHCRNSTECAKGFCCAEINSQRICYPLALPGYRCSNDQMKGNCYLNYCPCLLGYGDCQDGYCSYQFWYRSK